MNPKYQATDIRDLHSFDTSECFSYSAFAPRI